MKKIIQRISVGRNQKGFSYENMSEELKMSISAYRKIEIGKTKLTVERLYQIAEILDIPITELLDIKKERILNQDIKESFYTKVEQLYQDNKETYEKLIQAKDEQIQMLKDLVKNNAISSTN